MKTSTPSNVPQTQSSPVGPQSMVGGQSTVNQSMPAQSFGTPNTPNATSTPTQTAQPAPKTSLPTSQASPTPTQEERALPVSGEERKALAESAQAKRDSALAKQKTRQEEAASTTPTSTETTTTVNPDGSKTTESKQYSPEAEQYKSVLDQNYKTAKSEYDYATARFNEIAKDADDAQKNLIAAINTSYQVRLDQMETVNEAALNSQQLLGARSGRSRYAPELQRQILSAEERNGIRRLTEIEAERLTLISQAQTAATQEDLLILNNRMEKLSGLRDEQQETVLEMYSLARSEETRAQEKAKFALDMRQYENEIVRYESENEMTYANAVATSLVQFDETLNITPPTEQQIQFEAEKLGIDPNILSQAVFSQIQTIQKMGAEEYGTYFENQQFMADQAQRDFDNYLSTQKFGLEQQMFGLDVASKGFVWDETGNLVDTVTGAPAEAEEWAKLIKKGIYKPSDVPSELKTAVASALNALPPDPKEVQNLEKKLSDIDAFLNHSGLNDAVGPNALARAATTNLGAAARGGVLGLMRTNQARAFVGQVNSFLGSEVLQKLIDAKASGATFGALSEAELAILQVSSNTINQWARDADGDGRTDYYEIDEKTFKQELTKVRDSYQKLVDEGKSLVASTPYNDFKDFNDRATQSDKDLFRQFDENPAFQNATTEQILEAVNQARSFNAPLSTGKNSSMTDVSKIKDFSRVVTSVGSGTATGIEAGSKFWKPGFDFVFDGGKGAPVRQPFSGVVVEAGEAGGFGKSVVVQLPDGRKIRSSHLDSINVKPGQKVASSTVLGGQGNTGKTYGKTGIHVDYTMYKPDGSTYTSQEVASFFNTRLA